MRMKMIAALTLAGAVVAGGAQAQSPNDEICREQAQRLALGGESLTDFMAYCSSQDVAERPMVGSRWKACQDKTRAAGGRGGGDSSHTPQQKNAMKECMAGK